MEKELTQSMKDFAFRALSVDKQGPVWNSLQDDDEEMEEESEAGSGSSKEHKRHHFKLPWPNLSNKN